MADLMRFQIARAPQRRIVDESDRVRLMNFSELSAILKKFASEEEIEKLTGSLGSTEAHRYMQELMQVAFLPPSQRRQLAAQILGDAHSVGGAASSPLQSAVPELDRFLAAANDRPSRAELSRKLDELAAAVGNRSAADANASALERITLDPQFWTDRLRVERSLLAALGAADHSVAPYERRARLTRLALVFGFVEDAALAAELPDAEATHRALRARIIVVPPRVFEALLRPNRTVRRPGFADLYVTREDWLRYEPGEIAHIENVLAGELKERTHERLDENEETTVTETSESMTTERDTQTTERFELKTTASEELAIAASVEGSVDVKNLAPATTIETHVGVTLDASYEQANTRATTTAREVIARAAERVTTAARQARSRRRLARITETNRHTIDNRGNESVSGIYRWVDKVKRIELVRFPHRYLIELQLPEPGAWLRWALRRPQPTPADVPPNPPQLNVTPHLLVWNAPGHPNDYRTLAAAYSVRGLKPPPSRQIVATNLLRNPEPSEKYEPADTIIDREPTTRFVASTTVTVPTGYRAVSWGARIVAREKAGPRSDTPTNNPGGMIVISVGSESSWTGTFQSFVFNQWIGASIGGLTTGTIPISASLNFDLGFAINVIMTLDPTEDAITQWQLQTYEAIRDAYNEMRTRYVEWLRARQIQAGVSVEGMSPAKNRQLVAEEMKRQAVNLLIADLFNILDFTGFLDTRIRSANSMEPGIDQAKVAAHAPLIQFVEQAFEWGNMRWSLYPYFWTDGNRWPTLALQYSADPDFDAFLGAGAARLVVPARPGFESQVQMFLDYGIVWGGGPVPGPDDENYLSVADEIRLLQQGAPDGTTVDVWEVRLPTTLVTLDSDAEFPLKNPSYP